MKSVRIRNFSDPYFPEFPPLLRVSSYSVRILQNTDQKNSEYGHFSHSEYHKKTCGFLTISRGAERVRVLKWINNFVSTHLEPALDN